MTYTLLFTLSGGLAMLYAVIALFFLKFHARSRDRLFLLFAIAFFMLATQRVLLTLLRDGMHFLLLSLRPSPVLAAENLFLRKQLALYQERQVKPRQASMATRLGLIWLARWFDWHRALVIVQPATLIRWHRQGFRWFWRWTSRPGE